MSRIRLLGSGFAVATLLGATACGADHTVTATVESTSTAPRQSAAAQQSTASTGPSLPPRPATTSGPLTKDNLPAASRIGPRFQPYVEPDNPEEGIVSNGSAVHERDPQQAADGIVPLGCPGVDALPRLPVPAHALEETYRTPEGLAAVALTLEYGSQGQASRLVGDLAAMLATCTPPVSVSGLGTPRLIADVRRPDAASVFDTRREVGPDAATTQWDETVVRTGKRVSLVTVERPPTAPIANQRALATGLKAMLTR